MLNFTKFYSVCLRQWFCGDSKNTIITNPVGFILCNHWFDVRYNLGLIWRHIDRFTG